VATLQETHQAEYEALTQRCGLVDLSERGKLLLTGPDAKDFLHGQVTNDVLGLEPGGGCYAAFLTHKGKMLGDLRVLDGGEAGLWLDTERSALQELFNMIRRFKIGRQVELSKRTVERALFALVGPGASDVAGITLAEHQHVLTAVTEVPVRLVGTAWGVDVICDADSAAPVRDALLAAGAVPCAEEALEIVRVERGIPRFGVDLEPEAVIPQEAGLNERAVSFTKGCYVGQETVARLYYKGKPNRHLRVLRLSKPLAAGTPLMLGEREVGRLGTSVVSPTSGPLGLALVRREASPGDVLTAGDATAEVSVPPIAD